jgi:hypothetical protein
VEEALGLTPARKKFPLNMGVMNVMGLLLLMKAVMFKNAQSIANGQHGKSEIALKRAEMA